ncbi:hypothetical protein JMJ35_004471 [Cladonia borealis]|uniref:AB hydrolase-1 domain-containing protein n=1 Tax=Cladonia borealis TaxID=184061 RepID=A0AA39R452_9LECA|nr:hypothetical protein JMJ35_004471 [Cladonia borealis]
MDDMDLPIQSNTAEPQPAIAIPKEIISYHIALAHKPTASIHYSFARGRGKDPILVVFLNGLMTDKVTWIPVMAGIIRRRVGTTTGFPSMLAYDRYGQGMSDRDPADHGKEQGHGHDCKDAADDLHLLLEKVAREQMGIEVGQLHLVLVANSIGCAIARLYTHSHPVAALLFLDSIMANSNFDFWPDPDDPNFDKDELPSDVSVEVLREQRAKFAVIFHPNTINKEGLSRRSLAKLLPYSDRPMLGKEGKRPFLTVLGHDFETFADESLRTMGTPIGLSMKYSNPVWHKYNQGLALLTNEKLSKGPAQAKGCGHFIQRDGPVIVVDETLDLVDKVRTR